MGAANVSCSRETAELVVWRTYVLPVPLYITPFSGSLHIPMVMSYRTEITAALSPPVCEGLDSMFLLSASYAAFSTADMSSVMVGALGLEARDIQCASHAIRSLSWLARSASSSRAYVLGIPGPSLAWLPDQDAAVSSLSSEFSSFGGKLMRYLVLGRWDPDVFIDVAHASLTYLVAAHFINVINGSWYSHVAEITVQRRATADFCLGSGPPALYAIVRPLYAYPTVLSSCPNCEHADIASFLSSNLSATFEARADACPSCVMNADYSAWFGSGVYSLNVQPDSAFLRFGDTFLVSGHDGSSVLSSNVSCVLSRKLSVLTAIGQPDWPVYLANYGPVVNAVVGVSVSGQQVITSHDLGGVSNAVVSWLSRGHIPYGWSPSGRCYLYGSLFCCLHNVSKSPVVSHRSCVACSTDASLDIFFLITAFLSTALTVWMLWRDYKTRSRLDRITAIA